MHVLYGTQSFTQYKPTHVQPVSLLHLYHFFFTDDFSSSTLKPNVSIKTNLWTTKSIDSITEFLHSYLLPVKVQTQTDGFVAIWLLKFNICVLIVLI